jgi:hypothetical protein
MGNFSEPVYYPTGQFPLSADLGDVDGDGDLDVVTSNYSGGDYTLYENDGTGTLINRRNLSTGDAGSCSVFHDRDNDGDLDMTGVDEIFDLLILFDNNKPTDITEEPKNPDRFHLNQNYPNPFNPVTVIGFETAEYRNVSLIVYDVLGNEIALLLNKELEPGFHQVEFNAYNLPAGVYFYELNAGEFSVTKKMLLLK